MSDGVRQVLMVAGGLRQGNNASNGKRFRGRRKLPVQLPVQFMRIVDLELAHCKHLVAHFKHLASIGGQLMLFGWFGKWKHWLRQHVISFMTTLLRC